MYATINLLVLSGNVAALQALVGPQSGISPPLCVYVAFNHYLLEKTVPLTLRQKNCRSAILGCVLLGSALRVIVSSAFSAETSAWVASLVNSKSAEILRAIGV